MKACLTTLMLNLFLIMSLEAQKKTDPSAKPIKLQNTKEIKSGYPKLIKQLVTEDSILELRESLRNKILKKTPTRSDLVLKRRPSVPKQQRPIPIKKHKTKSNSNTSNVTTNHIVTHLKDNPQARAYFELLRTQNPKTGTVPNNIRLKELNFMRGQNKKNSSTLSERNIVSPWINRGPHNVGGRTRALAVDVNDENIILAGGVSGGMWRSADQGATWSKTTGSNELQSVSCIAQDTRAGQTSTWYYGTGEISGNSAGATGASYSGDGIYKSTDNGITWTLLGSTSTDTPQTFDQPFDYNYEIVINPTNGDILVSNYFGVYLSSDGGVSFSQTLENSGFSGVWGDIIMTSGGKAFAVIDDRGVYSSTDGTNWTDITPSSGFPLVSEERKELALASSNENIFYLIGEDASHTSGHSLWRFDDGTDTWTNLSDNIPQLGGQTGDFDSQGGYDLLVKVKPDDENFVIIGGTNLFASSDGFSTSTNTSWIGGYTATNSSFGLYTNHHPDQHSFVFLANNRAISGNDGGVQITDDITDVTTNGNQETVDWVSLNNGYLTTQVYALSAGPGDQIMAGFQDNSTWLTTSLNSNATWTDQFGGDGAYNDFNNDGSVRYLSSQNGNIYRVNYSGGADDNTADGFTLFTPDGYTAGLFIVPFYLDPINDDLFYLAGSSTFYVNTQASSGSSSIGWKTINLGASGIISEIGVTGNNTVYLGTTAGEVFKVENPGGTESVTNITDTSFPTGYVSGLGANQLNSDELIITFSNYSIQSVFHTNDGGSSWSNVSGNLEENADGSGSGPSVRTAQILGDGDNYFVGTSTGLYSTTSINGDGTVWAHEDADGIGEVVVEQVQVRASDGQVLAGTHGNGIYSAKFEVSGQPENDLAVVDFISPNDLVSGTESIAVRVQNLGTLTQSAFDMTYFVNDIEVATETVNQTLNPGDTVQYTFVTTFDFSTEGEYTIRVELNLASDENEANNSKSKFVVNAMFTGKFVLQQLAPTTTGPSNAFANGNLFSPSGTDIITLLYVDENTRGAFGVYLSDIHNNEKFFQWTMSNGEVVFADNQETGLQCVSHVLLGTADTPGSYTQGDDSEFTITLKEDVLDDCGNGSADVTFLVTKQVNNDMKLLSINSPSHQASGGSYPISISMLNVGTNPQSEFSVSYFVNDVLESTKNINETIESGEAFEYTFPVAYEFLDAGTYTVKAVVDLGSDENLANNEVTKTVDITVINGFEGPYILEQIEPTTGSVSFAFANGYVFDPSGSTSIFLENIGGGTRQFTAQYLPDFGTSFNDYRFSFSGNETVFDDNQDAGIGCGTNVLLGTADTQGTFDSTDDSEFTLNIKEIDPSCNAGDTDVAFRLIKVPEFLDLAVIDITNPADIFPNTSHNVQVAVHNFSNVPQDNFEITYYVNDVAQETEVFNSGINLNETVFFNFPTAFDFSVPGFYDIRAEVNLTGDEFADNNSLTKTVQSLEPIASFPYLQTFDDDAGALPLAWQVNFGDWQVNNVGSVSSETGPLGDNTTGTGYYVQSDAQNASNSSLISRHIDLSGLNSPLLTFYYHMFGTHTSSLEVRVNNQLVFSRSGEQQINQEDPYILGRANLERFAGQVVNIQFNITTSGQFNSEIVAIDDIGLEEALDHDLGIRNIMSPVNIVSGEEAISVTIENLGSRAQSEFDLSYYVDGTLISTEVFTGVITPGQQTDFTFSTTFDFAEVADYGIMVEIDLPTDELLDNNTIDEQVSRLEDRLPFTGAYLLEQLEQTTSGPSANFGNGYLFEGANILNVDLTYIDENTRSVSLDYFGVATNYQFSMINGEVIFFDNQATGVGCNGTILLGTANVTGSFNIDDDFQFTLTLKEDVTDDCATGAVDVIFRLTKEAGFFEYDLELTGINSPQNNIPLSRQAVGFSIQNTGSLPQGDFDASYYVDDVHVATETFFQNTSPLGAGFTRNFTFNTPFEFTTIANYDVRVVLTRAADDNPLNDETSIQIQTSVFNINALPISSNRVGIEWLTFAEITDVVLERTDAAGNFEDLVSIGVGETFYIDDAVDPTLFYSYRLRGVLTNGETSYSLIVGAQPNIDEEFAFAKVLGDVTGVDLSNNTYSSSWGDIDGDDDLDMVVSNVPNFNPNLSLLDAPTIYLNDGNGNFEKVIDNVIIGDGVSSRTASIIDYNNDGKVDVYLPALNSRIGDQRERLFRNNGALDFSSIAVPGFIDNDPRSSTEDGVWGDMDNDGDLDLVLAGNFWLGFENFLYENLGDGRLRSIKEGIIYETLYNSGMFAWTASWVDYDGDGDQDLFVPDNSGNAKMFRNLDNTGFEADLDQPFVTEFIRTRGAQWADFDQDGSLDLLMIDLDNGPTFFFNDGAGNFDKITSTQAFGTNLNIHRISTIGDINNNGKLDVIFASNGYFVYESNLDQTFTLLENVLPPTGSEAAFAGISLGDMDNDGDLDMFRGNASSGNSFNFLYENLGNSNNSIHIKLKGEFSNTDGIGAKIALTAGGKTQYHTVTSSTGLIGQNSLIAEFGLGLNSIVENITVTWPSGTIKEFFDIDANQLIEVDDSNAPSDVGLSNAVLPENLSTGAPIGASFTVDTDTNDEFTYEIVSSGGIAGGANQYLSKNNISGVTKLLSPNSVASHEANESYSYSSNVAGEFTIENGTIKAATNFDFETQSTYTIKVRTTDAFGNTFEKDIQIDILDVNEDIENSSPTDIGLTGTRINENEAANSIIGTLSSNDADEGSTHSYSLVDGDASLFQIEGDVLMTTTSFNFEKNETHSLTIRTIDDGGLSFDKEYVISVDDVNEQPIELFLDNTRLTEDLVPGSLVGLLTTVDIDNDDSHTYSLSGTDASSFQILGDELLTLDPLDFETKASYEITLISIDAGGLTTSKDYSILISDENDAPSSLTVSSTSIDEKLPQGSVIASLSTTDDDLTDTHSYSLSGTDAGNFKVLLDELRTAEEFNFESENQYEITLTVTDDRGLSYSSDYVINVNDVNDSPSELNLSNANIPEGLVSGTFVGSLSTLDEDAGDTHTFTFVSGSGDTDNSSFTIDGNSLKSAEEFDFETKTSYSILVNVSDGNGGNFEQQFTIDVSDIDETSPNSRPSSISITATSVTENESAGSAVGTLTTVDSDAGDTHTYSIVSGDASLFDINNDVLETSAPFDFESINSYTLTVRSTDAGGLVVDEEFTISIGDINEAPGSLTVDNKALAEGLAAGTAIGLFSTIDDDAGDTHTYSVSGPDAANFEFVDNELRSTSQFDFETQSTHGITVTVTDLGGLSYNQDFIISVTDVNEAPSALSLDNSSISEGQSSGTLVGKLTATDVDTDESQTYSLSGADASNFIIVIDELRSVEAYDFEAKASYDITITITDKGGLTHSEDLTIDIVDINEAPTAMSLDNNNLDEGASGSVVGSFTVTDQDASDTHSFDITGIDATSFQAVGNELQTAIDFNFEVKTTYNITVSAVDAGGLSFSDDFVITVSDVNEAPTGFEIVKDDIDEGLAAATVVGLFNFEDEDAGDTHTITLSGTDAASFNLVGLELQTAEEFNFEAQSSFDLSATVVDAGGLDAELNFTVNVVDVNEAPTAIELSALEIKEKEDIGTAIGSISVTDEDTNDTHTYTLLGDDAASFRIVGDELQSAESFDVGVKESYSISIEAFDGEFSVEQSFTITVTVATGFDEDDRLVKVYPNPSNGIFTVALDRNWANSEIKLFDLNGREIYGFKNTIINDGSSVVFDASQVPTGEYILKLINKEQVITKQIIITK